MQKHLGVIGQAKAEGKAPLSADFQEVMKSVIDEFVENKKDILASYTVDAREKVKRIADAAASVAACENTRDELVQQLENLVAGTVDLDADLYNSLEMRCREAEEAVSAAEKELKKARTNVFDAHDVIWPTEQRDKRNLENVFRTFDQAFKLAGLKQLEADMARATDDEFIEYIGRDKETLDRVLSSDKLGNDFQHYSDELSDKFFLDCCLCMDSSYFDKYIKSSQELLTRYEAVRKDAAAQEDLEGEAV